MALRNPGPQILLLLGSSLVTEVRFQVWPFQSPTPEDPYAQMLLADSALAPSSPVPVLTFVQLCPS